MIKRYFARLVLYLTGWKIEGKLPDGIKKCVVIMAPHTSYWDFVYGWLGYSNMGLKSKYLIKKEAFFFPLGPILKALGGIPVDRSHSSSVVLQLAHMFANTDELVLTITPEGTRRLNPNWKKGFYLIAKTSKVPVVMGYLDFKYKTGGLGPYIIPSGDYYKDLALIENFYKNINAKFPDQFSLSQKKIKDKSDNEG